MRAASTKAGGGAAPTAPPDSAAPERRSGIEAQLAALAAAAYRTLQAEWQRLFRAQPPKQLGRSTLELAVAWKLQERASGGHGPAAKRQLARLAELLRTNGDIAKVRIVSLKRGATLLREWNGETHQVLVLDLGFRWRGEHWASLSAVAREITGTRWSGPRFFGLDQAPARRVPTPGVSIPEENRGE